MQVAHPKSLKDVYIEECRRVGCKKNSELLRTLPDQPGDYGSLESLNLNLNCVGQKGIQPLLNVIALAPNLKELLLADNFLTNDSVKALLDALTDHPNLCHVDLSRNPISHVAGKLLSSYVSTNPRVTALLLHDTLINPALVKIIERKAEVNNRRRDEERARLAAMQKANKEKEEAAKAEHEEQAVKMEQQREEERKEAEEEVKAETPREAAKEDPAPSESAPQERKKIAFDVQEIEPPRAPSVSKVPAQPEAMVFLPSIFKLASEGNARCTHLELLSLVASQAHPNVAPVRRPLAESVAPAEAPAPESVPDKGTGEDITVDENDEWYGVKLLYSASLHDAEDEGDQWYGIRSVYAAVEREEVGEEEQEAQVEVQEAEAHLEQPERRRLSIMDPKEEIVQEAEAVNTLQLLRDSVTVDGGCEWGVLDFLLKSKNAKVEEAAVQVREARAELPVLRNLDLLFDTAAKSTEDMSGLEYLKKSMSLLMQANMGVTPSGTEEETEEDEEPHSATPSPPPRPDWYAMDLIWSIAARNTNTDWTALASVMSIINKD